MGTRKNQTGARQQYPTPAATDSLRRFVEQQSHELAKEQLSKPQRRR